MTANGVMARSTEPQKANAACFTWHMLHLDQPHAFSEQAKHTLPPLRARFHMAAENFISSLRVLQTLHSCVCSHVAQIANKEAANNLPNEG